MWKLLIFATLLTNACALPFVQNIFSNQVQATITNCGDSSDILRLDYLNFIPNPPLKGQPLTFDGKGFLKETVNRGAYIDLTVKYGLIKLLQQKLDLCDEVEKIGMQCPLSEGEHDVEHTETLPREIPPGKYTVNAVVYTEDHRRIACINAVAIFKP
ncbi:uncharacterized protein VTP21DRAFT_5156 [Calcarisporiella thermophila]|uniref:uncharacterized protein n=1 Tax=Calcarisporiella thermophila TaxID=911321 RepID=UPI0037427BF5